MNTFLDDNFLLSTPTAQELYHRHAAHLPIIDYHNHFDPSLIANDHSFHSITELWIDKDRDKWRAMLTAGMAPKGADCQAYSDWEKFEMWAATVPQTLRHPLYHWTHMELRSVFGIKKLLSPATAKEIYEECNAQLCQPTFTARALLRRFHVECLCIPEDPVASLSVYQQARLSAPEIKLLPVWCPDKVMNIGQPEFADYIDLLSKATGIEIRSFSTLMDALGKQHHIFHEAGCRIAEHNIEEFYDEHYTLSQINTILDKALRRMQLPTHEIFQFRHAFLRASAEMNQQAGWSQQYRFRATGEMHATHAMNHFFTLLREEGRLTRTLVFGINPGTNEMIGTLLGNFEDGRKPSRIQMGLGGGLLYSLSSMAQQLDVLSSLGLLSRSVGVATSGHQLLSFSYHEYFRRFLCALLGNDVEHGILPDDPALLAKTVEDICYNNARQYFQLY